MQISLGPARARNEAYILMGGWPIQTEIRPNLRVLAWNIFLENSKPWLNCWHILLP